MDSSDERRSEARVHTDDPAAMNLVDSWTAHRVTIQILDVSRTGMKLSVPNFLTRGTVVQLHLRNSMAFGEVRHCACAGNRYLAGVLLRDVFPPSRS